MRGSANLSAFAPAKFASRALAQSLAREFGPQGVHVAHVVIDGMIDLPSSREMMKNAGPNDMIDPQAVSLQYVDNASRSECSYCDRLRTATGTCILSRHLLLLTRWICGRLVKSSKPSVKNTRRQNHAIISSRPGQGLQNSRTDITNTTMALYIPSTPPNHKTFILQDAKLSIGGSSGPAAHLRLKSRPQSPLRILPRRS